jgi:hypothetical protein
MVVTFYSFKGGVGRSMALANVAELLAGYGYRVIVCDWDLEAPGLERYFVSNNANDEQYRKEMDAFLDRPGLVDLLLEYKDTLSHPPAGEPTTQPDSTHAQVGDVLLKRPSSYATKIDANQSPGSLRLLTAGRRLGVWRRRYGEAIRRFDWQEFYDDWAGDAYIDFFRRELVGEGPKGLEGAADLLLIDSRTGVTEQGGVCTHHLADLVLVLTAANDLNMEGAKWMVQALGDEQLVKSRAGRSLSVLPIASRIEQTAQTKELVDFRRQFIKEFGNTIGKHSTNPELFAIATEIPYMPYYSYHERVVAREEEAEREANYYSKYRAIADAIVEYGVRTQLLRERTAQGITARAVELAPKGAPSWSIDVFVVDLEEQLRLRQMEGVTQLLERLDREVHARAEPFPEAEADRILSLLARSRQFATVQLAAETFIRAGLSHPRLRLAYARALVEQANSTLALSMLQTLATETAKDSHLNTSVRGLLGRIYKQQYIESPEPSSSKSIRNLERAVNEYYGLYIQNPEQNLWAGINVVGLAARAQRDHIVLKDAPQPKAVASEIMLRIQEAATRGPLSTWDLATAVEACLALEQTSEALAYMVEYTSSRGADNFELTSARRQFTLVWGLTRHSEPGATLLPVLDAAILKSEGGRITVDPQDLAEPVVPTAKGGSAPKHRFDQDKFKSVQWFRQGLEQGRAVVRIDSRLAVPAGTGLLIRGDLLHPPLGSNGVLLTAAHVLSPDASVAGALRPSVATVVRAGTSGKSRETRSIGDVLFTSSPDALDITIAELDPPVVDLPPAAIAKAVPSPTSSGRVVLIGYPGGGELAISLGDGELLDYADPLLHYRCPVDASSSGSPIFDEEWNLLGIHHASATSPENRWTGGSGALGIGVGIWVGAITRELQRQFGDRGRARESTAKPVRRPVRVFVSYAHNDQSLWQELSKHLQVLKRQGLVDMWDDRSLKPGDDWESEISARLEAADIVLLLISADYIASDYLYSKELTRILEKHQAGQAIALPVLLRPVNWAGTPIAELQALPKDGTPVTVWSNRDSAWTSVAEGLRQAIDRLPVQ